MNQGSASGTLLNNKINNFLDLVSLNGIKVNYVLEFNPQSSSQSNQINKNCLIEPATVINSLDISPDGEHVAAATNDNTIVVLKLTGLDNPASLDGTSSNPQVIKHVNQVQKYGASNIKWLPNMTMMAITSSTKTNDDLRMVSLERPSKPCYQKYYHGHTCTVNNLDVSKDGRNIISSASIENKIFLWDVNVVTPIGSLFVTKNDLSMDIGSSLSTDTSSVNRYKTWGSDMWPPGMRPRNIISPQSVVSFDDQNMIFAVANTDYVKLFDLRNYSKGPFLSSQIGVLDKIVDKYEKLINDEKDDQAKDDFNSLESEKIKLITAIGADYNQIKFSPNGQLIVVNTDGPFFYVLDAKTLSVIKVIERKHRLYNNTFPSGNTPQVSFASSSFAADNKGSNEPFYIIGGNGSINDPRIYVWDPITGHEVGIINKDLTSSANSVDGNFNLAVNYVATCSNQVNIVTGGGHRLTCYKPSSTV